MIKIKPSLDEFLKKTKKKKNLLIWATLKFDLDTPVSTYLKLCDKKRNTFLLESVQDGTYRGRYSIIGIDPDILWKCEKDIAYFKNIAINKKFVKDNKKPLKSLNDLVFKSKIDIPDNLPPMASGLIGYLGYETINLYEKLPSRKSKKINVPDGFFIRPTVMAIFDSIRNEVIFVSPYWYKSNDDYNKVYLNIVNKIKNLIKTVSSKSINYKITNKKRKLKKPISNIEKNKFFEIVKKAKEYIFEGDIFQVVLSQRFKTTFSLPPFELYRSLRNLNPSPFLFYMDLKDDNNSNFSLIGSSPEILVKLQKNKITIRPIAGTRPRGKNHKEDEYLKKDLLSDKKELAEHLMLLDLGRNDVGRIAKVNTVRVTEKMKVELYSHVMHIVSNVVGIAKNTKRIINILMAGFPAGTVSGAPKIRAMEIINELEPDARGIYAGCVGYFSANGDMETCIVLRTAIIKDKIMYVQAGAGIVADSLPSNEYKETVNKAAALFKAAEMAYNNK